MNIDEELRAMLQERAAGAPAGVDLLNRVQRRGRALARRRLLAAVASGLAVVALVAMSVVWLRPLAGPDVPPASPTPVVSPTLSPLPAGVAPIVLAPADLTLPSFPLTPGWEPADLGRRWVGQRGAAAILSYVGRSPRQLLVSVSTLGYEWEWLPTSQSTVAVGPYSATLRLGVGRGDGGQTLHGLSWQLSDGRTVVVESDGVPLDEVLRFAANLRLESLPATRLPFSLGLAPQGFVVLRVDDNGLCLGPAAWEPLYDQTLVGGVCVHVATEFVGFTPSSEPIVAGLRGTLDRYAEWHFTLNLLLPDGRVLSVLNSSGPVAADTRYAFSDTELARFIENIVINPVGPD